jgi:carboxymethylenebutenolidase
VAGFCWGGSKTFVFAAYRKDLSAAFAFYGTGPADVSAVTAPVYGSMAAMTPTSRDHSRNHGSDKTGGQVVRAVTCEGAGHGLIRVGDDPGDTNPANKKAREEGFARLVKLLKAM